MSRTTMDLWVGVFVAMGIAALFFLALKVGSISGSDIQSPYLLSARFDNIGGLKARAPVRAAGVVIGRITSISLDPKSFQGVVTMEIERGYQFPKDSSAKILTAGLLGDQYVGIEAGGEIDNLAAGATIKQTQSAVVLENLIGQFLFNKAADAGGAAGGAPTPGAKP